MYPSEWIGNAENESGIAKFKIDEVYFSIPLQCFADYQRLSDMLDLTFYQGKRFAKQTMRDNIMRAMNTV